MLTYNIIIMKHKFWNNIWSQNVPCPTIYFSMRLHVSLHFWHTLPIACQPVFQATWTTSHLHAILWPPYLMDYSKHSEYSKKPMLCQKRSSISPLLVAVCKVGIDNFTASRPNVHTRQSQLLLRTGLQGRHLLKWGDGITITMTTQMLFFLKNQLFSCFIWRP